MHVHCDERHVAKLSYCPETNTHVMVRCLSSDRESAES